MELRLLRYFLTVAKEQSFTKAAEQLHITQPTLSRQMATFEATVASTMYDMTRVNANGYFDSEDSEEARYAKKQSLNTLRTQEYCKGEYSRAGGCVSLPVPEDAPFFVKHYSEYYKGRCYHKRSLNWEKFIS